jgi:hypothetical protein
VSVYLPSYLNELFPVLQSANEGYFASASRVASRDSLGLSFIVNQPLPIKMLLGSALLFIFPIPVWSGFQLESVYHLFKSFNAIFFYFLTPLFLLSMYKLLRFKKRRTPALIFNLLIVVGFTLAIVSTSMETRHFATFYVPLFVVALLPDLTIKVELKAYKSLLSFFLMTMIMVHFAWGALKLF